MGELEKVKKFLQSNRGYLKKSASVIASRVGVAESTARKALNEIKSEEKTLKYKQVRESRATVSIPIQNTINFDSIKFSIGVKGQNILAIGDLHSPWILEGYLEWCYELSKEYKTNKIILIGDIIDAGSWNYHEKDADGLSVGYELEAAIRHLKLAYKLFPEADITLGNHDLLIARKAKTAGLSQRFIRDLGEILECPKGWRFLHQVKYNDVIYTHGTSGNAFSRAKESRTSTVQGHLHTQSFIQYSASERDCIWGMQLGTGLDHTKYAFDYAKPFPKKPIVSAGVVLDNGNLPILRLMKL